MTDLPISSVSKTPAQKPEVTSPAIEAARADPKLPEKVSRLQNLSRIVLDSTGKFSEADRVSAYVSIHEMAVTGQMMGMGNAGMTLHDEVVRGEIGQKVQALHSAMAAAVMPIGLAGDGPGAMRAALAFYDGLSASDQDFLFQTSINAPMRDGKKFANVRAWQDNMNAAILMSEYTHANRDLIASGATSKVDDPKFAAALRMNSSGDVGSASWSSMVLKLFERPKDKIDLSDSAKRFVGDFRDNPREGNQYQEGSIASKTV